MSKINKFLNKYKDELFKMLVIILFFLGIYLFFEYLFVLIAPFAIGYLISLMLEPFVKIFMNKLKLKRGISGILSILLMIVILGSILFLGTYKLLEQIKIFLQNDPMQYFYVIKEGFEKLLSFISQLFFYIPDQTIEFANKFLNDLSTPIMAFLTEQLKNFGILFVKFIPNFFVYLFLGIISSFFFIKDKILFNNMYRNNVPISVKKTITHFKRTLSNAFSGYIKSQLIIMCFTFTITMIGLIILGNDYALLIGVTVALVDVLPLFGSGFILWPLSFISFVDGDIKMAVGALVVYGVIQITRQIIEPRILGGNLGIHPLATLMSMYAGIILFGFLGIILGPISVMFIKAIWTSDIKFN